MTDDTPFDGGDRATVRAAIDAWGVDAQVARAEEEAAEFIAASRHHARGAADEEEVAGEVADVWIMARALRRILGADLVDRRVAEKMDRLRDRLPADARPAPDGGADDRGAGGAAGAAAGGGADAPPDGGGGTRGESALACPEGCLVVTVAGTATGREAVAGRLGSRCPACGAPLQREGERGAAGDSGGRAGTGGDTQP